MLFLLILNLPGCQSNERRLSDTDNKIKVMTTEAKRLSIDENIGYSGTIEELVSIPLNFSVIGTVAHVWVSEGERVQKGQLLASLDDVSYRNAFEMALASEKQAEDAYKRMETLYKNGNLAEIKMIDIETKYQQAKSAKAIAKKYLEYCQLVAPVDGFIGKRSIEPGMTTVSNLSALTIVKIEYVYAVASVSENEIASVQKGQKAMVSISALGKEIFQGTVYEIGVIADPIAHCYKVKIRLPNPDYRIKPGMICDINIHTQQPANPLVVPSHAVQVNENKIPFVFVVQNQKAFIKPVQTGRLFPEGIEITQGLNEGEKVVISGFQKLVDHAPVAILNP